MLFAAVRSKLSMQGVGFPVVRYCFSHQLGRELMITVGIPVVDPVVQKKS